ncbi:proteasome-activating nucleotidase [Candidatus Micrarchaeota archaeon]|nr:MAG: proteasome-activating nucleotidase [Candidatus Micrarchaeota archaeon]
MPSNTSANKKEDALSYLYELEKRLTELQIENKMLENNTEYLRSQISSLREELARLRRLPLMVATVVEKIENDKLIVKNSNGMEFLVSCDPDTIKEIDIGSSVGLNQQTLNVVRTLPRKKDVILRGIEIIDRPKISFKDIGGLDEQVREIKETVELPLKNPELFEKVGIEAPSGVLLYGPPGCGKTLLAKAVAAESDATFIKLVGSELVQKFIGEGSKLVKNVFEMAKEKAPSIIFIDEIDAVGAKRLDETTGGDREVNRTLMQLLSEMDGFGKREGVKIIAATNRIDILDPALLRPGRFDRIIEVPLPDEKAREEIFKIHMRKMNTSVKAKYLAEKTEGALGAEIKAICTEAGMFAIREGRTRVLKKDFEKAIEKVMGEEESGEEHRLYI